MLYLVPALRAIVLLAIYKRVLVMLVHSSPLLLSQRHTSGPYILKRNYTVICSLAVSLY